MASCTSGERNAATKPSRWSACSSGSIELLMSTARTSATSTSIRAAAGVCGIRRLARRQVTNRGPDRLTTASPPERLMNGATPLDERERVEKVSDLVRLLARKPNRFVPFDGSWLICLAVKDGPAVLVGPNVEADETHPFTLLRQQPRPSRHRRCDAEPSSP